MNVEHWLIWLLNEIEWFQFQGIFEHAKFHAKGNNIYFYSLLKLFHIFLIRPKNDDKYNSEAIGIKFNNCERTVTY